MKNEEKLALIERFKQHAGVKEILLSDVGYMQGMSGNGLTTEKGNENSWVDISVMAVPANFFSFMNIPIEQGRLPQTEKRYCGRQCLAGDAEERCNRYELV